MSAPRVAVLASGEGQTLEALLAARAVHALAADVMQVLGNRSQAGVAQRARRHGIPFVHLSQVTHPDDAARDAAMHDALQAARVDWIVLAGYLKALGPRVLTSWSGRILNTHPSLLPRFGGAGMYGHHVHEAVLASGAGITGASVHYVTEVYDTGPVIAQIETAIAPGDTVGAVEARVKALEQVLLVQVLNDRVASPIVDVNALSAPHGYVVQPAAPRHLAALPGIELAAESLIPAGRLGSAGGQSRPLAMLANAQAERRLWVALTHGDEPVGFALALDHGDDLHLQEMDVHPAHGRRGVGAALLRRVCAEAAQRGCRGVTLTTFADLAWNAPFYARNGFAVLPSERAPARLAAALAEEVAKGLRQRVAMRRVV